MNEYHDIEIRTIFFEKLFGAEEIEFRSIRKGNPPEQYKGKFVGEMIRKLSRLNEDNYEIYFVVNSGGRSDRDIKIINSVFIDLDCGKDQNKAYHPLNVVEHFKSDKLRVIDDFELKPTAIIETRNGYHVYWFVESTATVEQFKECIARLIAYFNSDKAAKNLSRLLRVPGFNWCKDPKNLFFCNIVKLNDFRYRIEEVIDALPEILIDKQERELSVITSDCSINTVSCNDVKTASNKELIKTQSISALKDLIKPTSVVFNQYNDVYQHLRKQDLKKFLGINAKDFCCIFHDENSPSANIFIDPKTGYYWYKCFSCGIVRDIISITERWLQCSIPQALRFLRLVYNIKFEETDWQIEQKAILEENKRLLYDDERLSQLAPETYKKLRNYMQQLIILNDFAASHVITQKFSDNKNNAIFYISMKDLTRVTGYNDPRRLRDRVSYFSYLGLLNKLRDDQIPEFLLKEAVQYATMNNLPYRRAYYQIPSYCDKTLTFSESKAVTWKNSNYTMTGFSRELILRNEGTQEADRVYPQMNNKKISPLNEKVAQEIEKAITRIVFKEKGWTTQSEVLENLNFRFRGVKEYKVVQFKRCIKEILDKYGLKQIRLNKKLKKQLEISCDNYPIIITKDSSDFSNQTTPVLNISNYGGGDSEN